MKTLADGAWQVNPEFSRDVNMLENIGAAYVNFNHQLDKIKLQTGLRYEYTHTDLTTPKRRG